MRKNRAHAQTLIFSEQRATNPNLQQQQTDKSAQMVYDIDGCTDTDEDPSVAKCKQHETRLEILVMFLEAVHIHNTVTFNETQQTHQIRTNSTPRLPSHRLRM